MNNYDGLFILNIQGKDEGLKEAIDAIEKEIEGTALLGMLNSCSPNVTVVNIDNGFGAAYTRHPHSQSSHESLIPNPYSLLPTPYFPTPCLSYSAPSP